MTFYLWQLPPCVAAEHVRENHIRGHGVPYDMKSPGLHEVGAVESEKETEAMVSFPCP